MDNAGLNFIPALSINIELEMLQWYWLIQSLGDIAEFKQLQGPFNNSVFGLRWEL